jgi:hypothetical protein
MNLRIKLTAAATLTLLTAASLPAAAFPLFGKKKNNGQQEVRRLTPAQEALIDKSIAREKLVVESLKKDTPLVETYIQNMKPDPVMAQAPETDWHSLARVDFGRVINDSPYASEKKGAGAGGGHLGFFKDSLAYITHLSASLHLTYHSSGFTQMLLVDSNSYNRQMYKFSYVRAQFQGTVPVLLFDVQPVKKNNPGRFSGRIYVNRTTGDIVRFTGSFSGGETDITEYFHFDSWRTALPCPAPSAATPGVASVPCTGYRYMPYQVYVEETDPKSAEHTLKFKALTYIWGYQLKVPTADESEADIEVSTGNGTEAAPLDMTPLQMQHYWEDQAEKNVIDRMQVAGLVDAPSDNDKVLTGMANNILIYNKLPIERPLKVRTLLTAPLETLSIGHTILISKGLLDTTSVYAADGTNGPQVGNLYALLAFQVAHIQLGHRLDTKFAFNDRLLFPSEAAFQKLPMHHTDAENAAAAKKAVELLGADPTMEGGEQYFSLYLQQLQVRLKGLKALTDPQMGDSMIKPDGTFWLAALLGKGPKLNNTDLTQQAAAPLDSLLHTDAWTDQVITTTAPLDKLLSAAEKIPFEVHPVFLQLGDYKAAAIATPPPAPAPAATAAPATDATAPTATPVPDATSPAAAPAATDTTAPAATTGTSNPPADTTTTPPPATPPAAIPPQY